MKHIFEKKIKRKQRHECLFRLLPWVFRSVAPYIIFCFLCVRLLRDPGDTASSFINCMLCCCARRAVAVSHSIGSRPRSDKRKETGRHSSSSTLTSKVGPAHPLVTIFSAFVLLRRLLSSSPRLGSISMSPRALGVGLGGGVPATRPERLGTFSQCNVLLFTSFKKPRRYFNFRTSRNSPAERKSMNIALGY